jgi:hypothetical protein
VTLALIALVVLAVVVFAFVLEPIVRARSDHAVLDAAALPEHDEPMPDAETVERIDDEPVAGADNDHLGSRRVSIDRPAGSDVS